MAKQVTVGQLQEMQRQNGAHEAREYDVDGETGEVLGVRAAEMTPDRGPDVGTTVHQVTDDDRRFSGGGADDEPTSENAQQGSLFLVPEDAAFNGQQFRIAPELANIAERLIEAHGFLAELINCKLTFLWKRKTGVTKGKLKIGFLARGSGLLGHFSQADFLVWLSASTARDAKFTDRQVEAAVFHQLAHIGEDDNGNWIKVGHDFEGFASEVRIYGTWTEDLKVGGQAYQAARQLGLLDDVDDDPDDDDDDDGDLEACDADDLAVAAVEQVAE